MKTNGKCIIISAPSGAGKTTIVHCLIKEIPELEFSISAASREKRGNEVNGKDYYFLSEKEFKTHIENNDFIEWEEVYPGQFYGTLISEIHRIWSNGRHVIFEVDVIGGLNLKKQFGDKALSVFIMPPSVEELRNRLLSRDTETKEKIAMRVKKAESELVRANEFDKVIVNDNLSKALFETEAVVREFIGI